jgi:hypothetical protein
MSATPGETWRRSVDDKVAMFAQTGHTLPLDIASEASFVEIFEALCGTYNERYITRLLIQLQLDTINGFASALDEVFGHSPPNNLARTVFGGLHVVFKVSPGLVIHLESWKLTYDSVVAYTRVLN